MRTYSSKCVWGSVRKGGRGFGSWHTAGGFAAAAGTWEWRLLRVISTAWWWGVGCMGRVCRGKGSGCS